MNEKYLTELIKFKTETVKVFWGLFAILTGGLAAIFTQIDSIPKIILFFGGLLCEYIVIILINSTNKEINSLIKKLEEE